MKKIPLTSSIFAALALTASGDSSPTLNSTISVKEKELARLTQELSALKKQGSKSSVSSGPTYTVKAGDTLSKIGRQNDVTYSELIRWNNISDPSKIGVGQKLIVSGPSASKPAASKPSPKTSKVSTTSSRSAYYSVSRGDTFYAISRKNDISLSKLKELNPGVDPSRIIIGQKLKTSGSPAPAVRQASAPKKAKAASKPAPKPKAAPKKIASKPKAAPKKATSKPKAAPKKSSTTALTRSTASKKSSSAPTSSRKKSAPAPVAKKEAKPAPAPTPPKVEESVPAAPKSVSSIILTSETTFSDFASKHRTSTAQLNALNGWNLPQATVLARGSEIYVPK